MSKTKRDILLDKRPFLYGYFNSVDTANDMSSILQSLITESSIIFHYNKYNSSNTDSVPHNVHLNRNIYDRNMPSIGNALEIAAFPEVDISNTSSNSLQNVTFSFFQCDTLDIAPERISLSVLLLLLALSTIFGNSLVIIAICKERYLHTVTNYFIMSLAVADCLVGAVVMPFSAVYDSYKCWFFGADFCDFWHSFDVLASTASILNLCVISMDRYWAITDPVHYPLRMTHKKAYGFIALVWVCSALISFPAIAWWRARSLPHPKFQCHFTEDLPYLFFSSTISFYSPLFVMVFTYYRIYKAATKQTKALRMGQKLISPTSGSSDAELTLRIHRGGGSSMTQDIPRYNSMRKKACIKNQRNGKKTIEEYSFSTINPADEGENSQGSSSSSHSRTVSRSFKHTTLSQKFRKFTKEKKAAKTLGIVMGVFIVCWLPFFVNNLLLGLCGSHCSNETSTIITYVVTWLGWTNSAMNPVIYACMARDFRRAFIRILCSCCPRSCRMKYQSGWRNGIAQIVVSPVVSTLNTPFLKSGTRGKYASATRKAKLDEKLEET